MCDKRHSHWFRVGKRMAVAASLILIAIGTSACSSTGHNVAPEITAPRTARHPASLDSRLAPHYHLFVSILQSNGFEVGQTDDPRALELKFVLDRNPSVLELFVSLLQEGTPLLSARGSNSEGRTAGGAIAGSAHITILAQRAAANFERQLAALKPNLLIVEDSPPFNATMQK